MQTIRTKYHHPSEYKGDRISATATGGKRVICHVAPELNSDENHDAAAIALCHRLGWTGPLYRIDGAPTGYVYALEFVQIAVPAPKGGKA